MATLVEETPFEEQFLLLFLAVAREPSERTEPASEPPDTKSRSTKKERFISDQSYNERNLDVLGKLLLDRFVYGFLGLTKPVKQEK